MDEAGIPLALAMGSVNLLVGLVLFAGGMILCALACKNNDTETAQRTKLPISAGYILLWIGAIGAILNRFVTGS